MKENEIISYKPDLNIYGKNTTLKNTTTSQDYSVKSNEEIKIKKSIPLTNFIYYSPTNIVNAIQELIDYLEKSLVDIKENVNNDYSINYFSTDDSNIKETILEENNKDPEFGSNLLEAYSYIKTMKDDLDSVLNLYLECVFGGNVDKSEVEGKINEYISRIEGYEAREEYSKVNYMSLYYDSKVSYILSDFVGQLDNVCYDLSCLRDNSNVEEIDSRTYNLIKKYFKKEDNSLQDILYKCKYCKDNICIALKNLYLSKQEFEKDLNTLDDIYSISKDLYDKINNDGYNAMNTSVTNLIKSCMNYNLNYGDVVDSVKKKCNYRNFL